MYPFSRSTPPATFSVFFRAAFVAATLLLPLRAVAQDSTPPYLDPTAPLDTRVSDLLSRMTLDEKVGQLNQKLCGWNCFERQGDSLTLTDTLRDEVDRWSGVGAIYGVLRADPWSAVTWETGLTPEWRVAGLNQVQREVLAHSRLKIPALFSTEAPHGHMALGGTILPTAIGLASTWNPDLYQQATASVADEVRLSGEHLVLLSCLDVARDPRWGRTEECFGEDPTLAAAMARAATLGTQQGPWNPQTTDQRRVAVVLKHLAAQGEAKGGHNAAAANIGPRELREIHLPPVQAGVAAGAQGFMAAYNEIDGVPCCANRQLLTGVLRDEYGFAGMVMADGCALDNLMQNANSLPAAAALGLQAGVDIGLWDQVFRSLGNAVHAGLVDQRELDQAVARVLRLKFQLGLFDQPYLDNDPAALAVAQQQTQQLNLQLARESLVLLRNENHTLPFAKSVRRVAVIGPAADNAYAQLGDYTPPQRDGETTTLLAGIRQLLAPEVEVTYALGCTHQGNDDSGIAEAVRVAQQADVVIVAVGGSSNRYAGTQYLNTGAADVAAAKGEMDTGEGVDVASLQLGGRQLELVKALQATGRPLAVVLVQGRPYAIPWMAEHCPAIVCAWYPGQRGGEALAEVLFGDANPSGRLSISIPRDSNQLPVYYNHKSGAARDYYDQPAAPLYPFGYGLSYTTFKVDHLRLAARSITAEKLKAGETITVTVDVTNTGDQAGAETVQLYIHGLRSPITRRVRELKAFTKVTLQPGETQTVEFAIGQQELGLWGADQTFAPHPGVTEIQVQGGNTPSQRAMLTVR